MTNAIFWWSLSDLAVTGPALGFWLWINSGVCYMGTDLGLHFPHNGTEYKEPQKVHCICFFLKTAGLVILSEKEIRIVWHHILHCQLDRLSYTPQNLCQITLYLFFVLALFEIWTLTCLQCLPMVFSTLNVDFHSLSLSIQLSHRFPWAGKLEWIHGVGSDEPVCLSLS